MMARSFNGTTDQIVAATTNPNGFSALTLSAWINGYASPEPDGNGNSGTVTGTTRVLGSPYTWRLG
jgi:hypothetical protein